ncbi:hypothetical protein VSH64_36830 [Amycolatopsis rhabdoformis]|uniref:Anti-sigma factor n=1 Tax=Amycolatopsis rhabdoformis TaxID=1448059 RepID=A0ABZ1I3L1_9PSEU|nr:hypothetical protein [Amycolatopsis rhabdoformis]WSE28361.1 hypothetical protein VSH64_36830 [Amycolatopsis rhabdoformis]
MTDESRGVGGTVGPPWSVDVLADLHAGVLDEHEAAQLWPRVQADPEARAIIEALEATTVDLAALAHEPAPPMPAEFAARIDQALAAEAASRQVAPFPAAAGAPAPAEPGVAPVVDLAAARKRRNKRLGWGAGILTAAAAAIVALAITVPGTSSEPGTAGVAAPAPAGPSVGSDGSGAEALLGGAMGVRDFGPLQDEQRLDACVSAAGLDPNVRPEGIRPVTVDGKPGVLVIYTTGQLAQFRLVAFGADCGPGHANVLFDKVVGKK